MSERLGRGASLWVAPLKMIRKLKENYLRQLVRILFKWIIAFLYFFNFSIQFFCNFERSDQDLLPSSRDRPQTSCTSAFRAREVLLKRLPCTSRQGEVYGRRWLNTSRGLSPLYIGIPGLSREEGRSFLHVLPWKKLTHKKSTL